MALRTTGLFFVPSGVLSGGGSGSVQGSETGFVQSQKLVSTHVAAVLQLNKVVIVVAGACGLAVGTPTHVINWQDHCCLPKPFTVASTSSSLPIKP